MKNWQFRKLQWSPREFALFLQKCLKAKGLRAGMQVHATLLTSGTNMNTFSLSSKLLAMYAGCGDLKSARLLFTKIENPNVFAFNWMVLGLAYNGYYDDALWYFRWMRQLGHLGNKFTFPIVLKACLGLMDVNKGMQVHAMACEMGFQDDVSVANALIDMYCKCRLVSYACQVFDIMPVRDVASWTSMICGFCNSGKIEEALVLFERMKLEGLEPNEFTWNVMIGAYARSKDTSKAFGFADRMKKEGFVPDLVAWNALISGFVQNHKDMEALKLFWEMLNSGIQPNQVTIAALLPACGSSGYIIWGREIHGFILRKGFDFNVFIASALIDMYSKCGNLKDAQNVFDSILNKNVASWNAMIDCYGKYGMIDSSLELFRKLQEQGLQPNEVTFTCLLSACSHSGSVQKGLEIFRLMKEHYGIEATLQHYACVVDLFCRSGKTVEAYEFLKTMPMQMTESIAGAFLNGCNIHGRSDLAKLMVDELMKIQLKGPVGFVTLSNIYAADGEWDHVGNLRKVMKEKNVHKSPGFSWLEKPGYLVPNMISNSNSLMLMMVLILVGTVPGICHGEDGCGGHRCGCHGPPIRFPFRLKDKEPPHCGYPAFDLTCSDSHDTFIEFSASPVPLKLLVTDIQYEYNSFQVSDTQNCLPAHLLKLIKNSSSISPFQFSRDQTLNDISFFNCSPDPQYQLSCPIYVADSYDLLLSSNLVSCTKIFDISSTFYDPQLVVWYNTLDLLWSKPNCSMCETQGKRCKLKNNGTQGEVECFGHHHNNLLFGSTGD
ncbi:hypothetical protein Ahy_B10g100580 [Arachis hypogaea]|uniref:Wall-associated receptor kinase galacturonan-binding domain-containing protein n=1 Tax=Arachis hypogaea TaxID=3818 RepID=A0A444WX68_ARAHY|nr:hypothetical protein Ahy_B10g100580 [Arachis hypogaea]